MVLSHCSKFCESRRPWLVAAAEVVFLLSFLKSQSVFLSRNGLVLAFSSHLGGGNL
jgi:hypothetical protein